MKIRSFLLLIVLSPLLAESQVTTTVEQIVYDQFGPPYKPYAYPLGAHEGLLHGANSSWDWYHGARPGLWMNNGTNTAIQSWGQIFEWAGESPVTNVRFQIRNHKMYVFYNSYWDTADGITGQIECKTWKENYDPPVIAQVGYDESNNGGGISFPLDSLRILHWWDSKWPRYTLPTSFEAVYVVCEIRLIPHTDPSVPLQNAKYLAGVGADYYPYATYDPPVGAVIPSLTISRHKFITTSWKSFTAYIAGSIPTSESQHLNEILSRPLPPNVINTTDDISYPLGEMKIYPVPAQDNIFLRSNEVMDLNIELFDLQGKMQIVAEMHGNSLEMDISSLADGFYLLRMTDNEGADTFRKIIKR